MSVRKKYGSPLLRENLVQAEARKWIAEAEASGFRPLGGGPLQDEYIAEPDIYDAVAEHRVKVLGWKDPLTPP